ncbi:hypothetical protein K8T06_01850 [bacterium]|nr:hypothetical protein [bacterium]
MLKGIKIIAKGKEIVISNCTIGEPWIGVVDSYYGKEDVWTNTHRGQPIHHPGNGFGIVFIESEQLEDCKIQSNRYAGIVCPSPRLSP